MSQDSRDESITLKALRLDNQRLKRLYNKISAKNSTAQTNGNNFSSSILSARLYEMLALDISIDDKILEVISEIGNSLDLSQIIIYYPYNTDNFQLSRWNYGEDFAAHKDINDEWELLCTTLNAYLSKENQIVCHTAEKSDAKPIRSISEFISAKSIIAFPTVCSGKNKGFILFAENSFNREWTSHEVEMANIATNIVNSALNSHLNKLALTSKSLTHQLVTRKILSFFNDAELPIENAIQNTLALAGKTTHFERLYIVLQNNSNNEIEYIWQNNSNEPPLLNKDQLTNLSFDNIDINSPRVLHINSNSILNLFSTSNENTEKFASIAPIRRINDKQGWLIGESVHTNQNDHSTNELMAILALQIGNSLNYNTLLNNELAKQKELLTTRQNLTKKEVTKREEPILKIVKESPTVPPNFNWPNRLILLVDENGSVHLQIRKYFDRTNLTLVSARTVTGATQLLKNRNDINLVMMDLSFPDKDGSELITSLKNYHSHIPVIAHTISGDTKRLIEMGFDDCIAKPATKEEVLVKMQQYLIEKAVI